MKHIRIPDRAPSLRGDLVVVPIHALMAIWPTRAVPGHHIDGSEIHLMNGGVIRTRLKQEEILTLIERAEGVS